MKAASAQTMLAVWDQGRTTHDPLQRALILLQLSEQSESNDMAAALTIGGRDAKLLDAHEDLFGGAVAALASCTSCGQELESSFAVESLRTTPPAQERLWHCFEGPHGATRFRLPNTTDIAAVLALSTPELRRSRLLERLVFHRSATGTEIQAAELPQDIADEVESRMAALDPQAEINLEFRCDACGAIFVSVFDIAAFLWAELDEWARRTLREVHSLARGYGWSEGEVLLLHPRRRQFYLEMLSE